MLQAFRHHAVGKHDLASPSLIGPGRFFVICPIKIRKVWSGPVAVDASRFAFAAMMRVPLR